MEGMTRQGKRKKGQNQKQNRKNKRINQRGKKKKTKPCHPWMRKGESVPISGKCECTKGKGREGSSRRGKKRGGSFSIVTGLGQTRDLWLRLCFCSRLNTPSFGLGSIPVREIKLLLSMIKNEKQKINFRN